MPNELVYSGTKNLNDKIDGVSLDAGKLVLSPTRTYAPIIKDDMFAVPVLFDLIQKESKTEWKEMYRVFNMGHRMELYLSEEDAIEVIKISESFGVEAKIIGRVEKANTKKLTINSDKGKFEY